jgi:hypothetical protein
VKLRCSANTAKEARASLDTDRSVITADYRCVNIDSSALACRPSG